MPQIQGQEQSPQPPQEITLDDWDERVRSHYDIPQKLWRAMAEQESSNDINAVSPTGVRGRRQVTKATARQYGYNRDDPFEEAAASGKHLRTLYDGLGHIKNDDARWWGALAEYYGGGNAIDRDGNLSEQSLDGISNPREHVNRVARRLRDMEESPAPQSSKPRPMSTAQRLGLQPAEGMEFNLNETEPAPAPSRRQPQPVAKARPLNRDQQIADIENQMRAREMQEGAIAETRARLGKLSPAELTKEHARLTKIFATVPETAAAHAEEERRRAEYYAQPLYKQIGQEIGGGMAEAGAGVGRMLHRVGDPIMRGLGYGAELDKQLAEEAESERLLAEKTAIANRLRSKIVRGGSAAAGQAATLIPVAAATGPAGVTALTALQSDVERDPGGALASTIAAPIAMATGRFTSPLASRAAGALTSRPAQAAVRMGVEGLTGAGMNAAQYAATAAALGRPVTAEDIAEQAIVGAGTSAATAMRGERAVSPFSGAADPAIVEAAAQSPSRAPITVTRRGQPGQAVIGSTPEEASLRAAERAGDAGLRILRDYTTRVAEIERAMPEGPGRQAELKAARAEYLASRQWETERNRRGELSSEFGPSYDLSGERGRAIADRFHQAVGDTSEPEPNPEAVTGPHPRSASQLAPAGQPPIEQSAIAESRRTDELPRPAEPAVTAPAGAPAAPPPKLSKAEQSAQEKVQRALAGIRIAQRYRQQADNAKAQGDLGAAQDAHGTELQALRDAMALLPKTEIGKRAQLNNAIAQAQRMLNSVSSEIKGQRGQAKPQRPVQAPPAVDENAPTVELPQSRTPGAPERPQAVAPPRVEPDISAVTEPTNRILEGEGAELPRGASRLLEGQPVEIPGPRRPQTERLPVPKATPENIKALRARRAELDRLAFDRRGDFTGDLRDEHRELGAVIREYENQRAPRELAPPPGQRPEKNIVPPPEERAARRAALQPKPEPVEQGKEAEESPTVVHSNPEIDRKPILAETSRGTVIVPNPKNKTGISEVKNRAGEPTEHKFSSTQVNLPENVGKKLLDFGRGIPRADLAEDGRETEPHITVQYGLHGWDPKFAREALAGEGPIRVKFGKVSLFDTNPDFDVVKVDIDSPDLHRLNKLVAESQPVTGTHPEYKPHATIAYVKKGQGAKYVGDDFLEGQEVTLDRVTFSGRNGEQVEIPLTGKPSTSAIPAQAMPELRPENAPRSLAPEARISRAGSRVDYTIPEQAAPDLARKTRQPDLRAQALARAVGRSAGDETKVKVADLGLESKTAPSRPARARAAQRNISIDDITLGRDELSRGRMFQVRQALRVGVKPERHGVPLKEQIDPIEVVPDPAQPGKWIVDNDGNHRVALLKLQGFGGEVPVKAWEAPTRTASRGAYLGSGLGGLQDLFERTPRQQSPAPPRFEQQDLFKKNPKVGVQRIGREILNAATLPRALMASADLSAPLRQGAILTLPPTQWGKAGKSGLRMLQALKTSRYNRLVDEMNSHPGAKVGKAAGLYMSTDPARLGKLSGKEEAFISGWAEKIPIVKHSEQAYKIYLDSIRLETFIKYERVINSDKNLSFEDRAEAYKAAADWINIASGRGSLGETLDKAMPALSAAFFAPRYTASRIQVLNPMTYLKNSTTAGGRAVLKQQMGEMVQFAGMTAATLALAKAAGASVTLNPEDADFLKIRLGNTRYDTLAGLQQLMRLYYRVGKDFGAAAQGRKSAKGENSFDILSRFGRSKLAPIPSFFTDMISRKDFTGRKFETGRAVADRVFPLMWKDFYDAYEKEGLGGAAKVLPGALGVGVQNYDERPGVMRLGGKLDAELQRHGLDYGSIPELPGDTDKTQRARAEKVERWLKQYGGALVASPRYKSLKESQQKEALENLRHRIGGQSNQRLPDLSKFNASDIIRSTLDSERERPARNRRKIVVAPN